MFTHVFLFLVFDFFYFELSTEKMKNACMMRMKCNNSENASATRKATMRVECFSP